MATEKREPKPEFDWDEVIELIAKLSSSVATARSMDVLIVLADAAGNHDASESAHGWRGGYAEGARQDAEAVVRALKKIESAAVIREE